MAESGIKANLALSSYRFIDENETLTSRRRAVPELVKVTEKWNGFDDGRIKIDAGIYGEYISNYRLWEGLVATPQSRIWECSCILRRPRASGLCLERTGMNPASC